MPQTEEAEGRKEAAWEPNTGVQTAAYDCEADVFGYGAAAGGGKTDLLIGKAGTKHWRSIIFRRVFPSVRGIIDRSREIFNSVNAWHSKDSFNESLHVWRLASGRMIEFGALQYEKDKEKHRGIPRDFYGFDEATEFTEGQVRFVIGWNRSTRTDPATGLPQKCQVGLTFNPPMTDEGQWVIKFFGPWLDKEHPNPAKDGELRWFGMAGDEEEEFPENELLWYVPVAGGYEAVDDGTPFQRDGRWIIPQRGAVRASVIILVKSRTFFHASLSDNPILEATGYGATIDSLPEPLRSFLKGDFDAAKQQDPWQVIPAVWVQLAQQRWKAMGKPDIPMTAAGVDVAHGGKDKTVLAPRHGNWFAPLHVWKGIETPDGQTAAAKVWPLIEGDPVVNVDAIGYGASCCERLQDNAQALQEALREEARQYRDGELYGPPPPNANAPRVNAINVGERSTARDKSKKYGFANLRAELYWKLREALDPTSGQDIALPPDQELLSDLCAAKWEPRGANIVVESKEDIKERIDRSPDRGDAVLLTFIERRTPGIAFA